jgi:hypothetical protein
MFGNHTGYMKWPLSSASGGDNPTPTAGQETVFAMNTIPKERQGLATYVYGIGLQVQGDFVQSGGTGVRVLLDNFVRFILASLSLRNAWHGTPVNTQWWTGAVHYAAEYVINGYRHASRRKGAFPAANATYPFTIRLFLPLCLGLGKKPHHTAQLALLYDQALLGYNFPTSAAMVAFSPGSSLANLSLRATAYCGLDPEIRLGPVPELVNYQAASVAQTNQEVKLLDFGNQTALDGVERSAGIVWSVLLGNLNGMPGPFDVNTITRFSAPWRNQMETSDVGAFYDEMIDAQGPQRLVGSAGDTGGAAGTIYDYSGYPNVIGATGGTQRTTPIGAGEAVGLGVVNPGHDLEFSKIQTVGESVSEYVTTSAAPAATGFFQLTCQLKRFTEQKREDFLRLIVNEGLARKVLGPGKLAWKRKTLSKLSPEGMDSKKTRYFPWRVVNESRRGRDIV